MNTSFLSPLYWFSLQPAVVDGMIGKFIFGFFLLFVLIGIVSRMVATHASQDRYIKLVGKKFVMFFLTMGILGMVEFFFSYENISLFGARFWYPIWLIATIVWLVGLIRFAMRDIPEKRERDLKQHAKSIYIPGRKRSHK